MKKLQGVIKEFMSQESNLFIYSLSFGILLSLAPSLLIFAMLFNFGQLDINVLIDVLIEIHFPVEEVELIFNEFMSKDYSLIPAISTLCVSFWLASRSIYSFLLISANHEDIDVMKYAMRIQSILMFMAFAAILVAGVVFGTFFYRFFDASLLPLFAAAFLVPVFTLMYRSLSFCKRSLTFGLIGGLFSTTAILIMSYFSFIILRRFITYQGIYGPLASLVILLFVIYLISGIIYFGFLINLVFEDSYDKKVALPLKHEWYYTMCAKIYQRIPFLKRLHKK